MLSSPITPPLVKKCCVLLARRISIKYWPHMGGGVLQLSLVHPMLGLSVRRQGTCRQVYVTIGTADFLAELVPVGVSLSRHLEYLGLYKGPPK